jgi:hypothetical protein
MLKRIGIAAILLVVTLAGAATIVTTRAVTKVYPNPIRRVFEQPIFILEKGEVVEVLQWGKPLTQIRNRRGRVGYVDIDLLDSLRRPPILRLMIDSTSNGPAATGVPAPQSKSLRQVQIERQDCGLAGFRPTNAGKTG